MTHKSFAFKLTLFFIFLFILAFVVAQMVGPQRLSSWWLFESPLYFLGYLVTVVTLTTFVTGWVTNDYSWVDRLWSIVPAVYAWYLADRCAYDPRLVLASTLITLWAARLTFNFARKGGYTGEEDYRWKIVKSRINQPVLWQIFNLLFIAFFQNFLLVLLVLPLYQAYQHPTPLQTLDFIAAAFFLTFLILETIADQQQWKFHQNKKQLALSGNSVHHLGFYKDGLFKISRHPNFFFEQAQWYMIYLFGVAVSGAWLNIYLVGPLLLSAIFQGSVKLTEEITASKYQEYAEYQRTTSRQFPWWPKKLK